MQSTKTQLAWSKPSCRLRWRNWNSCTGDATTSGSIPNTLSISSWKNVWSNVSPSKSLFFFWNSCTAARLWSTHHHPGRPAAEEECLIFFFSRSSLLHKSTYNCFFLKKRILLGGSEINIPTAKQIESRAWRVRWFHKRGLFFLFFSFPEDERMQPIDQGANSHAIYPMNLTESHEIDELRQVGHGKP